MFPFKVEISFLLLLTTISVDPTPVPGLLEDVNLLEEAENLSRDINSIYTGWVNSSFIYPYYLKVGNYLVLTERIIISPLQGSTIVNDLYGSVNRTGLVVAGAALLGVSGQLDFIINWSSHFQDINYRLRFSQRVERHSQC